MWEAKKGFKPSNHNSQSNNRYFNKGTQFYHSPISHPKPQEDLEGKLDHWSTKLLQKQESPPQSSSHASRNTCCIYFSIYSKINWNDKLFISDVEYTTQIHNVWKLAKGKGRWQQVEQQIIESWRSMILYYCCYLWSMDQQ